MSDKIRFTIPPPAPWWEFLLARWFGRKIRSYGLTGYMWRGVFYVTNFSEAPHD